MHALHSGSCDGGGLGGGEPLGVARHQVGAVSTGVIVSKHKGDVLACAALAAAMRAGAVERSRYLRNPLDVLAQQLVAMAALEPWRVDDAYALVRRTDAARDGEIVVALIDDAEATLKYFRREGAMIRLDPAM